MKLIKRVENVLEEGLGSIEQWDNSMSNVDFQSRINTVSKIASVCYGKDDSKNPEKLYKRLSTESMGFPSSSFEFVILNITKFVDNFTENIYNLSEEQSAKIINTIVKYGFRDNYDNTYLNLRAFKLIADMVNIDVFNTKEELVNISSNYFLFKVEMDIVTARQWVRHRTGGYNEKSRRYTKDLPNIYTPEDLNQVVVEDIFGNFYDVENYINLSLKMYQQALKKTSAQNARYLLPLGTMTTVWIGGTVDYWDNWLKLRLDKHSQPEIRKYAIEIAKMIGQTL